MSNGVNKVILLGNLGADPEIRQTKDGKPIANMRIATTETWRDRITGDKKERTQWHTIVVFSEGLCRVIERHVRKGSRIYIEGQLQTRKWTDQSGQDKYSTEVVLQGYSGTMIMLDGRGNSGGYQSAEDMGSRNRAVEHGDRTPASAPAARDFDLDDDIPF